MCDDLITVSLCVVENNLIESYINSIASYSFLQCGISKGYTMHVGKYKVKYKGAPV